jgi:tRNA dimethylallyltransferase
VYRGFDVATAKPAPAERQRVPHHLVDCADPRHDFSVADYVREAQRAVEAIRARGRVPIVVGGTGLYLRGLLRGIVEAPGRDPALRQRLGAMARRHGTARLHRWLARLDPGSAARLGPSDAQRVVRALEVALRGPVPWGVLIEREGTWTSGVERWASLKVGLDLDRAVLGERLDRRVEGFFRAGLIEEVRALLRAGVPPEANAFKGIGYREVLEALIREADPGGTVAMVQRNTRRYAKRQRTWLRSEPGIVWLDAGEGPAALSRRIVALWREWVRGV